jgi:hypothetical protein
MLGDNGCQVVHLEVEVMIKKKGAKKLPLLI